MSTPEFVGRRSVPSVSWQPVLLTVATAAAAVWIGTAGLQSRSAFVHEAVPVLLVPLALWLFFSERYEVTLAVLLLYLGLLDGVLKLASGSTLATLGRDVVLYAITLGAVVRMVLRKTPLTLPPFTGFALAWLAVCVMQVANPADISVAHAIASLRQHLEFVPLFFFGYFLLRSERRLIGLLMLLIIVAAANGIVELIQTQMTPAQLASWGPGYRVLEFGIGDIVPRTFVNAADQASVRPPGLGGTDGFGGVLCMMAVPAVLALLSSRKTVKFGWLLIPAMAFMIVGIVSSQARLVIVTSVLAFAVFGLLTLTSRRGLAVLLVGAVAGAGAFWIGTAFISNNANRYSTIAPSHVLATAASARSGSLGLVFTYLARYPLGAGLGSVGPASESTVGGTVAANQSINGETEFNFLLVETGIPGLVVMIVLFITVVRAGLQLRRVADPGLQRYLMAIVVVLFCITVSWFDTSVTANSPFAPFLWLSAGGIAFWYEQMRAGRLAMRPGRFGNYLARR
jgi:hypothetical protein